MIDIEAEIHGLDEVIEKLRGADRAMADARRRGLASALRYIQKRIYDWIQSEGEGNWPDFHPLTQRFQKKGGGLWGRRGRLLSRANWNWLMRFVHTWESRSGYSGGIEYGKEREGRRVSRKVVDIECGRTVAVTPAMRRMMAATRQKRSDQPGVTFFPLRKSTVQLTLPKRPVVAPVFAKERFRAIEQFEKIFGKELEKRL